MYSFSIISNSLYTCAAIPKSDVIPNSPNNKIGTAAIFIYIETFTSLVLGFLYWIVMSKIGNPEIIGVASTVITFSGILAVVSHLGIPTGIQRYLGKSFAQSTTKDTGIYIQSSLLIVTLSIALVTFLVFILQGPILTIFKINQEFLILSLVLMISTSYATFFRGLVISSLRTRILTIAMILSGVVKLFLGVVFIAGGLGAFGLLISFTINQVLVSAILAYYMIGSLLRNEKSEGTQRFQLLDRLVIRSIKDIFSSSIVSWVPLIITTIGAQVGTIFIYQSSGSENAGLFFISLTIVTGIISVMYSLFTISFPAMSAMSDGRKRFTLNIIRISLVIAIPFTSALVFYTEDILSLLGEKYMLGSLTLDILLLSMLPTAIHYGITSLFYSYGDYRKVLFLGLSISLPRIVFYLALIPFFGGIGGAIGYSTGALIGFIYSVWIGYKIRLKIPWRQIFLIFAMPMIISFIVEKTGIYYVYGLILCLGLSYIMLFLLKLLKSSDIMYVMKLLPPDPLVKVSRIFKRKQS